MTSYFHQNWMDALEADNRPPTVEESIASAIERNPPEALQKMAKSLQLVLQENLSEEELSDLYYNRGDMAYDPGYDNITLRAFTQYALDALLRSPKLKTTS
jgi:lipoprotein NlpI